MNVLETIRSIIKPQSYIITRITSGYPVQSTGQQVKIIAHHMIICRIKISVKDGLSFKPL